MFVDAEDKPAKPAQPVWQQKEGELLLPLDGDWVRTMRHIDANNSGQEQETDDPAVTKDRPPGEPEAPRSAG